MFKTPESLGLIRTLELTSAPQGRTFFYRNEHKRVIESAWADEHQLRKVKGPCVYVVAAADGTVRYVGKHQANTPVGSRWYRKGFIHHGRQSRNHIIRELDQGSAPFMVWSSPVAALRDRLPAQFRHLDDETLACALEALWIKRWSAQLWNEKREPEVTGFDDGEYWLQAR